MQVTVAIPTYKTRSTVFRLLESLKAQSFRNFDIMVVYKEWPGCRETLGKIRDYKGLDIALVKQDRGLFEEALNTIYRKADGDVVIHTDDDAHASRDWIKDHVELHKRHRNIGMATGIVDESTLPDGTPLPFFTRLMNEQKWRMNKHTIIDRPIDKRFKDYGMYIGKSGMLVDTGRKYNMIKTFKQHGVNMSWKRNALHGFKLPGYTKNGIRNEACAALEAIKRRFSTIWFEKATVFHPLHSSVLSRGSSIRSLPMELITESVLFSYYVSRYTRYTVNLELLKRRTDMDSFVAKVVGGPYYGYDLGYDITENAIRGNWSANRVRAELIQGLSRGARR